MLWLTFSMVFSGTVEHQISQAHHGQSRASAWLVLESVELRSGQCHEQYTMASQLVASKFVQKLLQLMVSHEEALHILVRMAAVYTSFTTVWIDEV